MEMLKCGGTIYLEVEKRRNTTEFTQGVLSSHSHHSFRHQTLSFFFLNRSLLEYNCFPILCQFLLHNKANQPQAYTCPHIPSLLSLLPILPISPLQVIAKHGADLPVLCCCFLPANYFTFSYVYMSMLLSLRPSFPLLPHVLMSILYVYLFIPAVQLGSSVPFFFFFRLHIYALAYGICFSLSDLLHSV